MNAAGVQETHRRTNHIMASADSAGQRVDATFKVATGPNTQVTGRAGNRWRARWCWTGG